MLSTSTLSSFIRGLDMISIFLSLYMNSWMLKKISVAYSHVESRERLLTLICWISKFASEPLHCMGLADTT